MEPQPPKSVTDTDELNTTGYTLDPDMDKIQRTERTEQTPAEQCHRQLSPEKSPTIASQQHVEPQAKSPVQVSTSMYLTRSGRASRPNRKYMD